MNADPNDPALIDAANAAVDTAMITLDWHGVPVTVPSTLSLIDPDALEAMENGKAVTGLRLMMGSDEYELARRRFKKLHGRSATLVDIGGEEDENSDASQASLAYLVMKHFGFIKPGE